MWQRSVGLSGSCGQLHIRTAREEDYCLINTNPYREGGWHQYAQRYRQGLWVSVHGVNICTRGPQRWTLDSWGEGGCCCFLCHPSFSLPLHPHLLHTRQECPPTQPPILCLKSHLHLCAPTLSFPSSACLNVISVSLAPPRLLQLQPGLQTPSLSSSSSLWRFCTWPHHTCHLHRRQNPGTWAAGAFIHSSPRPSRASHPLIPAPCHWGMAGAEGRGRVGHRAPVVKKKNVLSGARGNQCRWGVCLRASFAVRFDSYFFFLMIFLYGWVWGVDELNECMSWGAWTWECAHNNMLTVRVVALSQWFMRVCCEGSSEQDIVPWLVTSASLSLCVCV